MKMRKIINGKIYDTEKATEIGTAAASCGKSDFRWYHETLYQTQRSKTFFLAGEGGAMTRWSKSIDSNSWSGGSGILPLTSAAALEWAEQYLDASVIEVFFKVECH